MSFGPFSFWGVLASEAAPERSIRLGPAIGISLVARNVLRTARA